MAYVASRSRIARSLTRILMALAFGGSAAAAGAQTYLGTLFTGLYSTPGEAGSGVTATHEEPVIFLTFYIYRGDGTPYWLTATVMRAPDVNGVKVYTGDLYENSGPPFGGPFDPTTVTRRKVGPASFMTSDGFTITLTYSVDGVSISKTLTRFTLVNLDFSGTYVGTIVYQTGNCSSPALNGRSFLDGGLTTVTQPSGSLTIVEQGSNATCTLAGNYMQRGSLGNSTGNFSCTNGDSGPMVIGAMQMTGAGFTANFSVNTQQCQILGALSGILLSRP